MMAPELDRWLADPALRVRHRRPSDATADALWRAAREIRLRDTATLGRLVRWRIPGLTGELSFDELFRAPPFTILQEGERLLVSGLVGRIWTLRRDYPLLRDADEFRGWSQPGTARVLFANWVADGGLESETRVQAFGAQGRLGLAAVRPLVAAFGPLVGSEAIAAAVRRAEGR
ncbi:MAG: hypothetical protein ACRDMX_08770 [Solirubrobacteraceae bacterium]